MGSGQPGQASKYGVVLGTTSAIDVAVAEFTPRKVVLRNATSGDELTWTQSMPPDYGFKRVAAGTGSYVTSGGVTPVRQLVMDDEQDPGRGFTIGTDSDINDTDEPIHWEAWE